MKKFVNKLKKGKQFLVSDVWDIEITSLSALRRIGIRTLRVIHLVFKGFKEDECPLHASALTFNTLLAIVPILALSLGLARVFAGPDFAERQLKVMVYEITARFEVAAPATNTVKEEIKEEIVVESDKVSMHGSNENVLTPSELSQQLNEMVDAGIERVNDVNFAALGSVGFIFLIWGVIAVLGRVESSFNRVWGISTGRPMLRKFTDYLFMVIILPFLITMASSISVAELITKIGFLNEATRTFITGLLGSIVFKDLAVVAFTTMTFTVLIKFMPNTKVRLRPALVGGIIAALLFILWLWVCATVQVGVVKASKFYGSFAIVPIVLFWVFVSWEIILFGAEVAFAVQNCATYRMEQGARRANIEAKLILSLSVIVEAARSMLGDNKRFDVSEYAAKKRVPVRFLNEIVDELVHSGFLAGLSEEQGGFVLLNTPASIKVKDVIDSVMHSGVKPVDLGLNSIEPRIYQVARTVSGGVGGSDRNTTIEDMLSK